MKPLNTEQMIKEHIESLNEIVDAREKIETKLNDTQEKLSKGPGENNANELYNRENEFKEEIENLNARGRNHILKIDQLMGVR